MRSNKTFKKTALFILMILTFVLLLASCSASQKLGEVDPSSITYDGDKISWSAATNAQKYKITINGTDYTAYDSQIAHRTDANQLTVEITPIGKKDKEGEPVSMTFTKLPTIEKLYFDANGTLTWDAVAGASAYIVKVNGKESDKLTSCSYSNFERGRSNTISVRATSTDNSTFSYYSEEVTKTYLAAPSGIVYDGEKITWTGSSQASGYEIIINGQVHDTVKGATYFMYDSSKTSFNLAMRALGDEGAEKDVFPSPESTVHRYVYLAAITDFRISSGIISWDAVPDATEYKVLINSRETVVKEPRFEDLTAGMDNLIKIKPHATSKESNVTYFSEWSLEQKVHILPSPLTSWNSSLALDGEAMNAFTWELGQGNVGGYSVMIKTPNGNEETHEVSKDRDNFGYAFIESGEYEISVKAVPGTGAGIYESKYSEPIKVIRLAAPNPQKTNFITSNPEDLTEGFTVNFESNSHAIAYKIFKEGIEIKKSESPSFKITDIVNSNVTTRQEITYQAQAIGSNKETYAGNDRVVTLSSLSADNYKFKITVLASPENVKIEGRVLSWDTVTGNSGYNVIGAGSVKIADTDRYDLSFITVSGDYNIQVCARGDGASVLASPVCESISVRKLAPPTEIHVATSGESEGKLLFNLVEGATGYNAFFNGEEKSYDATTVTDINKHVPVTSVSIRIIAVADKFDEASGKHLLSSEKSTPITLTKLTAPYFNRDYYHDEVNLLWTSPTNITAATPGYYIYNGQGLAYEGIYKSTSFDLSDFPAGTYTFTVKAVGDGRTTINSNLSDPITLTKLEKPTVTLDTANNAYVWARVSEAQGYVVRVNGNIVKEIDGASKNYFSYTPVGEDIFKANGSYTVTVTAVSDEAMDSGVGAQNTVKQQVKLLTPPTVSIKHRNVGTDKNPMHEIIVTAEAKAGEVSTGYIFEVGGVSYPVQTSGEFVYSVKSAGQYFGRVRTAGDLFGSDGIYYINSNSNQTGTITILGTPSSSDIKLSTGGKLTWLAVDNATLGYEIIVDFGDGTTETYTTKTADPYFQFELYDAQYKPDAKFKLSESANYTFYIRARGNTSGTVIASTYVEWRQGQ